MAFGLTDEGFNRKRLVDIIEEMQTDMKAAFGDNIDLDDESGFGQFITIVSEAVSDQWESQEDVYNSQYPPTSSGTSLSNVLTYNGLERGDAAFSTIETVTLTGIAGTPILAGNQASVLTTGFIFATDEDVVIGGGGTVTVSMTATTTGPISATAGTLTVIETPFYGWTGVSNDVDAIEGENQETDPEARERRDLSVAADGQNLADALLGQLLALDSVIAAIVIDNKTSSTDIYGVPAHEFECIVQGGTAADIGAVVWSNTPTGIQSHGDIEVVIIDSQGNDQSVYYSEPTEVPIYFKVDITIDSSYPTTGDDDIKAAIVEYGTDNFSIGDDIIYSQFFTPINETDGILTIDLYMDDSAAPTAQTNVAISLTELGTFSTANIAVNDVT